MTTVTRNGRRPSCIARGAHADLIGWIPGGPRTEARMHVQFDDFRQDGEWFHMSAEAVRQVIWADPSGVDLRRMSAMAVFVMMRQPELTRADLTEAGVGVEAVSLEEAMKSLGRRMAQAVAS